MKLAIALSFLAVPALALTAEDIDGATYDGGDLPDGQSALTAKLQVLLDRSGISPGVVDGYKGGMSESAIRAFEAREGFEVDGVVDQEVWAALGGPEASSVTMTYTITEEDAQTVPEIPTDYAERAEMERLGYVRVSEAVAEKFHMDEDFLLLLNEGAAFEAGAEVTVVDPGEQADGEVTRIVIDKQTRRVLAYSGDAVLTNYPAGIGSDETPSPSGTVSVEAVAVEPNYTYNPDENFQQGDNDEKLILPPGANGPVGLIWIDLSEPTYGIHGTPEPAKLFEQNSHGCVRLSNWDAQELAQLVSEGIEVEFRE